MCLLLAVASCTQEIAPDAPQTPTDVAQLIKIAPFPAFDEGAQTRAVGTEDAGKTTWENGDVVLLEIQFVNETGNVGSPNTLTLTYNGTAWKADKSLDLNRPDYRATTATVTAYYAPDYAWVADEWTGSSKLTHKGGSVQMGTSEFITYQAKDVNLSQGITIDFTNSTRNYSRLRIATLPNATINVELSDFKPAPSLEGVFSKESFPLTADDKGNAYLYGNWYNNITVKAQDNTTMLVTKTGLQGSSGGQSYALAAYPEESKYDKKGDGTPENPYQIWNAEQLQSMRNVPSATDNTIFKDKCFQLITDIDCSSILLPFDPIGSPGGQFAGTFDGNGHTISNLNLGAIYSEVSRLNEYSGLFGTTANATIRNLTLLNPKQTPDSKKSIYAGALIGKMFEGNNTITNCHVVGNTELECDSIVGGLIGYVAQGTLQSCSSAIPVYSQRSSGGLVGQNANLTLISSYATGSVRGLMYSGGLVGVSHNLTIIGCRATGEVSNNGSGHISSGGLVGKIDHNIWDEASNNEKGFALIVGSSASGKVSSSTLVGGLVGNVHLYHTATVLSSYTNSEYRVTDERSIGSLVGTIEDDSNCFTNLYYSATTSKYRVIFYVPSGSIVNEGAEINIPISGLYAKMVNDKAEAKWQESTFDTFRAAINNMTLAEIWKDNGSAVPTLWWEK